MANPTHTGLVHRGSLCAAAVALLALGCNARKVTPLDFVIIIVPEAGVGDAMRPDARADADVTAPPDVEEQPDVEAPLDEGGLEGGVRPDAGCDVGEFPLPPTNFPSRASIGPSRMPGNADSRWASTSGDGQFVAFDSDATNLVANDVNGATDVFLRDRRNSVTTRISVGRDNAEVNGRSYQPRISSDGRWVVFTSEATNFMQPEFPRSRGVFLYGNNRGLVQRIDATAFAMGTEQGSTNGFVSSDGSRVVFSSDVAALAPDDSNNAPDTYLWERETQLISRISNAAGGGQPRGGAIPVAFSTLGTHVAMVSPSGDLSGPQSAMHDLYVLDRSRGAPGELHVVPFPEGGGTSAFAGTSAGSFSRDGRYLAFVSYPSTDVVGREGAGVLYRWDAQSNTTEEIARNVRGAYPGRDASFVAISQDGQRITWVSDTIDPASGCPAGVRGLMVYDRGTGARSWQRLSAGDDGHSVVPLLGGTTADGTIAVFTSTASDLPGGSAAGISQAYVIPIDPSR